MISQDHKLPTEMTVSSYKLSFDIRMHKERQYEDNNSPNCMNAVSVLIYLHSVHPQSRV